MLCCEQGRALASELLFEISSLAKKSQRKLSLLSVLSFLGRRMAYRHVLLFNPVEVLLQLSC